MENKTCKDCYWYFGVNGYKGNYCAEHEVKVKQDGICEGFRQECESCNGDRAMYKYNDKYYCFDCLSEELELETYSVTQYYNNEGECLGDSEDMDSVISNLDEDIEILEE